MARYRVTFTVNGKVIGGIKKKVAEVLHRFDISEDEVSAKVEKLGLPESRAARLQEIRDTVEGAAADVESLKDEMQDWYDSIPDSLQGSSKADEVQDAVSALETLHDELDNLDFDSVSFPGMF